MYVKNTPFKPMGLKNLRNRPFLRHVDLNLIHPPLS